MTEQDLIRENAALKAENARRRQQVKELRGTVEKMTGEHERALTELRTTYETQLTESQEAMEELLTSAEALETERDEWKTKYEGAPDEFGKETLDLRQQLIERDHRDAFREHIYGQPLDEKGEVKLRDDIPVADLWSALGYKPEGAVDPAALKQRVLAARESGKGYLFAAGQAPANPPGGGTPASKVPPLPPGPGAPRGATQTIPDDAMVVTRAEMRSPRFTIRNQEALTKAAKEGKLHVVEERA